MRRSLWLTYTRQSVIRGGLRKRAPAAVRLVLSAAPQAAGAWPLPVAAPTSYCIARDAEACWPRNTSDLHVPALPYLQVWG